MALGEGQAEEEAAVDLIEDAVAAAAVVVDLIEVVVAVVAEEGAAVGNTKCETE